MVTVVVKLFSQGFAKHNGLMTEDELEGEGAPHTAWGFVVCVAHEAFVAWLQ